MYKQGEEVKIQGVKGGRFLLTGKVIKLDTISRSSNRDMDYYIVHANEVPNLRLRVRAWALTRIRTDANEAISWSDMKHIWNPKGERNVNPTK